MPSMLWQFDWEHDRFREVFAQFCLQVLGTGGGDPKLFFQGSLYLRDNLRGPVRPIEG